MKQLQLLVAIIFNVLIVSGQDAKLKDNIVSVDGKDILKYNRINSQQFSLYSLDDVELIYFKDSDNGTPGNGNDDYYIINFLVEKIKVESDDKRIHGSIQTLKRSMLKLVELLLKDKVLDNTGKIDKDKLEIFQQKYHQNITERTIR